MAEGAGAVSETPRKPKLAVWKFSSCDGCQLSLLSCEDELLTLVGQVEIAYFLEASRAVVEGPYDLSLVEGSITTELDAERIHRGTAGVAAAGDDRGVRHRRRDPGAAQLHRRRGPDRRGLPDARVRRDARALDADQRPRPGRFRAAGLPGQQVSAARGDPGLARRPRGPDPRLERLPGVQAARQQLRHGRSRHALPGPGDARRLRRFVPVVQSRLLRLLRADGVAQHPQR